MYMYMYCIFKHQFFQASKLNIVMCFFYSTNNFFNKYYFFIPCLPPSSKYLNLKTLVTYVYTGFKPSSGLTWCRVNNSLCLSNYISIFFFIFFYLFLIFFLFHLFIYMCLFCIYLLLANHSVCNDQYMGIYLGKKSKQF